MQMSCYKKSHFLNMEIIGCPVMIPTASLTCPAEVRARDDWLPAHTFLMMNPCSDSMILGRYTRLVSPWPSLPAGGESHKKARRFFYEKSREGEKKRFCRLLFSEEVVNRPLSPPPKDHTVRPSCATAMVWELPQATCPTPLMSFTRVGTLRLWLSLWPERGQKKRQP